jgi:hypothetical protein
MEIALPRAFVHCDRRFGNHSDTMSPLNRSLSFRTLRSSDPESSTLHRGDNWIPRSRPAATPPNDEITECRV